MKRIVHSILGIVLAGGILLTSCSREFTETQFHQSELAKEITSVEQLQSFINGMYVNMRNANYLGSSYRAYAEVRSDEMYNTGLTDRLTEFSNYTTLKSYTGNVISTWSAIYEVVENANIVINTSTNLSWGKTSEATKIEVEVKRLKGQAYAVRALAFFDLLRLYGQKYTEGTLGVVLPLVNNNNAKMPRATIEETEAQIEKDFQAALDNIGSNTSGADKTYISPLAVKALMTRYYLYKEDWDKVKELATEIVDSGKYKVIPSGDLKTSFSTPNSLNSIFELALGLNGALGTISYEYLLNSRGYTQIGLLEETRNMYETNDVRKGLYVKVVKSGKTIYALNDKFQSLKGDSNIKVIRYEEVLLNVAEALFMKNEGDKAKEYINLIRKNRGLEELSTSLTIEEIKKERVRELVGEGFRYWDLLRWGDTIPFYNTDGVKESGKDRSKGDKLLAMPIPQSETNVPNSPIQSNPGYDN